MWQPPTRDTMQSLSMVVFFASSIAWTYIAQTTGSLIPSMIAHAMTNGIPIFVLFNVWIPFAAVTIVLLWQIRPILNTLRQFAGDWQADQEKSVIWIGITVLVVGVAAAMFLMSRLGSVERLLMLGAVGLSITVANFFSEKRI